MISFNVKGDTRNILRDVRLVSNDLAVRSTVFAINRVAQATETRVRRATAKDVGVAQKWIRPKIRRTRATFRNLTAHLMYYSGGVLAYKAGKRPTGSQFVATMQSGHTGIFHRVGQKRLPIEENKVALTPSLMRNTERLLATFAQGEYRRVFTRDLKRRLAAYRPFLR